MLDLVFSAEGESASGGKNYISSKTFGAKFFKKILDTGIRGLQIKEKKVEVSLSLVGEAKIRELNKKYRNKDRVTDVLSFPLEESGLKKYDILPLGDIFICLHFAVKESERQKISLEKELAQLTVHGFLHLLGYDHEKSVDDAKKMFGLEKQILSKL